MVGNASLRPQQVQGGEEGILASAKGFVGAAEAEGLAAGRGCGLGREFGSVGPDESDRREEQQRSDSPEDCEVDLKQGVRPKESGDCGSTPVSSLYRQFGLRIQRVRHEKYLEWCG